MKDDKAVPRRERLTELLLAAAGGLVIGTVILVIVDGVSAAFGWGRFGQISGWLAGILPVWLFVEEFKAWRAVVTRAAMALVAVFFATPLALAAASLASGPLPPLGSGVIGAAVGSSAYAVLWFVGIRWLAQRADRGVSR
jgi:hypothetical protein